MQIYLAYLVSLGAKSFPSGVPLAEAAMKRDGMGSLQVHHVFPRKYAERIEGAFDVNTMANYVILTREDHEPLGDEDPKVAYEGLSVQSKRDAREQFIPFGDPHALLPDAYEAFTKRRAREMASALNEFLGL